MTRKELTELYRKLMKATGLSYSEVQQRTSYWRKHCILDDILTGNESIIMLAKSTLFNQFGINNRGQLIKENIELAQHGLYKPQEIKTEIAAKADQLKIMLWAISKIGNLEIAKETFNGACIALGDKQ